MKVWVIGDPEAVLGFALVGIRGEIAETAESMNHALDAVLTNPELGLVLVTDNCSKLVPERMTRLLSRIENPLFVEIPSPNGLDSSRVAFTALAEQAIGVRK